MKRTSPAIVLIYRLTIVMFLFSVCRILFYLFNAGIFPGLTPKLFFIIMMGGLRFDLTAVLYTNLLYAFLMLIPFRFRLNELYQRSLDLLFYVTNSIVLALNCIDFVYFPFTQRRTTLIILEEFKNETNYWQLATHFLIAYFYILLIWIALILLMVWLSKKVRLKNSGWKGIKFYALNTLVMIVLFSLIVIGLRSGLPPKQDFPLMPSDAGQYVSNPNDVAIVQNTPFCMFLTWDKPVYKKVDYFSEKELDSIYSPIHLPDSSSIQKKMNVVILICESLGKEPIGFYNKTLDNGTYKGVTPFLDSLANHSLVYLNSYSNSKISIDGSPSVLASIPSLQESYNLSFYANNKINSLASCLSAKGYETAYAHAAPNGSLGLNAFATIAGVSKYIGKTEYANDADFDGVWGIWDHKFLPFFARQCSGLKPPFLSTVFTLSSHDPCKLPDDFPGIQDKNVPKIHKSINYLDHSLKLFFQEASSQSWYNNTIFVITGDHTCTRYHDIYLTALGYFGVPIIFYTPGKQLAPRCDSTRVAQQIDIMPTILNYLGYDKPYFAFGKDLFNPATDDFAIDYIGNSFQMVWKNWVIQFDGTQTKALYDHASDPFLKNNLANKRPEKQRFLEQKVKAIIQQYNNRLADNRMLPD